MQCREAVDGTDRKLKCDAARDAVRLCCGLQLQRRAAEDRGEAARHRQQVHRTLRDGLDHFLQPLEDPRHVSVQ